MIPRTSTFPKGPHYNFPDDAVVQILTTVAGTLRFRDAYVADLQPGDEYYIPIMAEERDVPRTGDMILAWMEENGIEIQYGMDIDGDESIELYGKNKRDPLVRYPIGKRCLREAAEFCMDQSEVVPV